MPWELRKRILRLNLFLLFAMAVAFTSLVFSYVNQLFVSSMVHLFAVFLVTMGFFLNKDGKLAASKIVGILTINLHLLVISHLEGLRSGTYMLIFPLLFTLVFVIDIRKSYWQITLTGILTLANTIFIFLITPYENALQKIPKELYSSLFNTNLCISLTLTAIFAFIILKTMDNHEMKILEEKNLSETIYDTSLDAVFIVHASSGMVTGCNSRALEVFGYDDKTPIINKPAAELLGENVSEHIGLFNAHAEEERLAWDGNMELIKQSDIPFHAYVNIVPFHHEQQLYCKISILDITDIKVAEFETIRAKEKAEKATLVKSRFLSMMSHELRTPLNGIIGTTNLLLQDEILESQKPYMDVLKHSSEHMLNLVNEILDFSKLEAGKMILENNQFNLRHFLQKAAQPFKNSGNGRVRLIFDIDESLDKEIVSDELRLNQVLNNLLSNACKFTEDGQIVIRAKHESSDGQNLRVTFSVSDTGIGIAPQYIRQIFESFTQADAETTRKFGGTGLGLAISRHIVEKMGGELMVKSILGKGSEFHFTINLRISKNRRALLQPEKENVLIALTGLRILIAEDNPVNLIVVRRFMQKWGIRTDEAANGLELLELYHRNEQYDLLLIDLEMPEMDGAQAVAEIRKTNTYIPIIAFTAAVYDNIQADLMQKGFNDFIPKPFKPEVLHRKIRQLTAYSAIERVKYV
jgi:signal transduction histidine kinase/CheY-like chemotaxis protein